MSKDKRSALLLERTRQCLLCVHCDPHSEREVQVLSNRNGGWEVLEVILGEVASSLVSLTSGTRARLGKREWKQLFSLMERVLLILSEWKVEQILKDWVGGMQLPCRGPEVFLIRPSKYLSQRKISGQPSPFICRNCVYSESGGLN